MRAAVIGLAVWLSLALPSFADDSGWCATQASALADLQRHSDARGSAELSRALRAQRWQSVKAQLALYADDAPDFTPAERAVTARLRNSLALIPLAAAGDDRAIRRRLADHADPNIAVALDMWATPLAWAAGCNHLSTLRLLIAHGAEINRRFDFSLGGISQGSTALIWASRFGATDTVRELLKLGADVTLAETSAGRPGSFTALDAAVSGEIAGMIVRAILRQQEFSSALDDGDAQIERLCRIDFVGVRYHLFHYVHVNHVTLHQIDRLIEIRDGATYVGAYWFTLESLHCDVAHRTIAFRNQRGAVERLIIGRGGLPATALIDGDNLRLDR